jgi:hypothetical protein
VKLATVGFYETSILFNMLFVDTFLGGSTFVVIMILLGLLEYGNFLITLVLYFESLNEDNRNLLIFFTSYIV